MKQNNISYNYDRLCDILYVSIGLPRPSYGGDISSGIIARYDMNTDELTGVTILDCKMRYLNNDPALLELTEKLAFPADIDFQSVISL
jgi:hypothetical protein